MTHTAEILDAPLPRTQAAARRLDARQAAFCHYLMQGLYGVDAYRLAYGESRSGCPRKAAAKIKAGARVRAFLDAFHDESCLRERLRHEALLESYRTRRSQAELYAVELESVRRIQAVSARQAGKVQTSCKRPISIGLPDKGATSATH